MHLGPKRPIHDQDSRIRGNFNPSLCTLSVWIDNTALFWATHARRIQDFLRSSSRNLYLYRKSGN